LKLSRVAHPPLIVGLPITWHPSIVAAHVKQLLYDADLAVSRAILDGLLAPWGCRHPRPLAEPFVVLCGCGRYVDRLVLGPDARWACHPCLKEPGGALKRDTCALLFALRLGFRGKYPTRLHLRIVRRLLSQLPQMRRADRLTLVTAATVVISYEPRRRHFVWAGWRPGPLARYVGPALIDGYLEEWASPVAYAQRCLAELAR
jgi:hypothetical protein